MGVLRLSGGLDAQKVHDDLLDVTEETLEDLEFSSSDEGRRNGKEGFVTCATVNFASGQCYCTLPRFSLIVIMYKFILVFWNISLFLNMNHNF